MAGAETLFDANVKKEKETTKRILAFGVQRRRTTAEERRSAGEEAMARLEAAQRRVAEQPRGTAGEEIAWSFDVPHRSLAHLDPVLFMNEEDEREASGVDTFALGKRAPVQIVRHQPQLASEIASELPPIPETPTALRSQLGREDTNIWTRDSVINIPRDLRNRWNASREGWWGWHLVDGFVKAVDFGSPCDKLGITVGSVILDWEPKLCPEGLPCWPIGAGTQAAEKFVIDVSPHGHVVDDQHELWQRPWLSKVKSPEQGETTNSPRSFKRDKNDSAKMSKHANAIGGTEKGYRRPVMSFKNREKFTNIFEGRKKEGELKTMKTNSFHRAVNLYLDERVANDEATIWCNETFGFRILSVMELLTAIPYLCILDSMFPGRVSIRLIANLDPKNQKEISHNWKQLRTTWFEKQINEEAIIDVNFKALENPPINVESHMSFLTSLKRLYIAKQKLRGTLHKHVPMHDPLERRRGCKVASWIKEVPRFGYSQEETKQKAEKLIAEIMKGYANARYRKQQTMEMDRDEKAVSAMLFGLMKGEDGFVADTGAGGDPDGSGPRKSHFYDSWQNRAGADADINTGYHHSL
jgi:hypothetical protein